MMRPSSAPSWFTDYADRDRAWALAAANTQLDRQINFGVNRALVSPALDHDDRATERLLSKAAKLSMPAWFIHGDGDPRPAETVIMLAGAVPNSRMELIPGAGHEIWTERPDQLRVLLRQLLTSVRRDV